MLLVKTIISQLIFTEQQSVTIQGEVVSRKSLFFLSNNKNLLQRQNTHYSFSLLSTSYKTHEIFAPKYYVTSSSSTLTGKQSWLLLRTVSFQARTSPQSRCNFGERVLGKFFNENYSRHLDLNGSGRLGRERNLYQGDG